MPTYQYTCGACGHSFEHLQSITEKKLRKCPKCGKFQLHRLIGTGSGIIFKGNGFYETDYKRSQKESPLKSCPANCESKATCPAAKKPEN